MATIEVILGEKDTLARRGARRDLEGASGIKVVGDTHDGNILLAMARKHSPQVAVVSTRLDTLGGLDVVAQLDESVQSLLYTSREDGAIILKALEAGARGYVLKWDDRISLPQAVKRVAAGEVPISEKMVGLLAGAIRESANTHGEPILTDRERQILELLGQGKTYKQMAAIIGISEHTVKTRCSGIYRKLNVHNQTGAVRRASTLGLIAANDD